MKKANALNIHTRKKYDGKKCYKRQQGVCMCTVCIEHLYTWAEKSVESIVTNKKLQLN